MTIQLSMLDLFSGSGSASRAAEVRGWNVFRIDNAIDSNANLKMDLDKWFPWESEQYPQRHWDLIWSSPPCDLLTTVRPSGRDVDKGVELVRRSIEIIQTLKPKWWVIENVHGATRAISHLIGPPVERYGSFYLWGCFPPFKAVVPRNKSKMSGRRRAERRARIPWEISYGLITACEKMDIEIRAISDGSGVPAEPRAGAARGELGAYPAASGVPEGSE